MISLWTAWMGRVPNTFAQVALNAGFDHGSLESWSGNLATINLVGRDNYYGGGQWRWLYFQASGIQGAATRFTITSNFAGGSSALNAHRMVYSFDQENWSFFDNGSVAGGLYQFWNDSPFAQNQVYIAYAQPYSYARYVAHTQSVLATPWAEPTDSGGANGVIGMSPGGVDDLGRVVGPRAMYAYRISNFATDSPTVPKRKIVLTSGLHAGEVLGTYTLEGMVDWLVSDDPRAARLRDIAEFFVYPMLNPDGRFAGNNRATIQNPDVDPNGYWHPTRWQTHDDIQISGEAMLADVVSTPGGIVDAFIDFHSTIPTSLGDDFGYIEYEQGDVNAPFWQEFRHLQPNVVQTDSTGTSWTTANFADLLLNAEVDITLETSFGKNRPLSHYENMGRNFGIAFYNVWVPQLPGDYNANGIVDAADYTIWRDMLGSNTDLRANGDDTGESAGIIDQADFDIWKSHFGQSAGSGAAQSNAVLEPAAALLILVGLSGLSRARFGLVFHSCTRFRR